MGRTSLVPFMVETKLRKVSNAGDDLCCKVSQAEGSTCCRAVYTAVCETLHLRGWSALHPC